MWNEEELIEAVARGEEFALEILVEMHYNSLWKYTLVILKDEEDAEEVVNETFFRAFRYARNFRGKGSFAAWIFKIAKNLSIDYLNKKNKYIKHPVPYRPEVTDRSSTKKTSLEEKLLEEMDKLKPEYREIILLKDIIGYSIKDISKIMNKSNSAVKTLHHRAVKSLRKKVNPSKGESR